MLEELVSSISSWFTPTVLFVVLNLTIATILLTSSLTANSQQQQQQHHHSSPSLLHRLKSISFHSPALQQEHPAATSPSMLLRLKSITLRNHQATTPPPEQEEDQPGTGNDEIYSQLKDGGGEARATRRMKKSASAKAAFEVGDVVEARRPATAREAKGDEEVDLKAEDFINKFKQQLKLQRLESIIKYKDTIARDGNTTAAMSM